MGKVQTTFSAYLQKHYTLSNEEAAEISALMEAGNMKDLRALFYDPDQPHADYCADTAVASIQKHYETWMAAQAAEDAPEVPDAPAPESTAKTVKAPAKTKAKRTAPKATAKTTAKKSSKQRARGKPVPKQKAVKPAPAEKAVPSRDERIAELIANPPPDKPAKGLGLWQARILQELLDSVGDEEVDAEAIYNPNAGMKLDTHRPIFQALALRGACIVRDGIVETPTGRLRWGKKVFPIVARAQEILDDYRKNHPSAKTSA